EVRRDGDSQRARNGPPIAPKAQPVPNHSRHVPMLPVRDSCGADKNGDSVRRDGSGLPFEPTGLPPLEKTTPEETPNGFFKRGIFHTTFLFLIYYDNSLLTVQSISSIIVECAEESVIPLQPRPVW